MGPFKGEVPVFARLWPVRVRVRVSFTTGSVRSAILGFLFMLALSLGFTISFYHFLVVIVVIYFMILQLQQLHGTDVPLRNCLLTHSSYLGCMQKILHAPCLDSRLQKEIALRYNEVLFLFVTDHPRRVSDLQLLVLM